MNDVRTRARAAVLLSLAAAGCQDLVIDLSAESAAAQDVASEAAVVVLVNPTPSALHKAAIPAALGEAREDLEVAAEPGGEARTQDGVAVVSTLPGPVALRVGDASLELESGAPGDVLDLAIAYDGAAAEAFTRTPVRYPVGPGGGAVVFEAGAAAAEIDAKLAEDAAVVVLRPGTYVGDLSVTGEDVIVFGEGWAESAVVIDGAVKVQADGVRLRGLTITGGLEAEGDDFGLGFSRVLGGVKLKGEGAILLRNVFCKDAAVASAEAVQLDNRGIAPLVDVGDACAL